MASTKSSRINNEQNARYLQAMGIQSWALRAQPLTSVVAKVVEKVVEEVTEEPVDDVKENVAPVEVLMETAGGIADVVERDATPEISNIDVSQLDWLALQSMVSSCTACGLHESRTNTVCAGYGDWRSAGCR